MDVLGDCLCSGNTFPVCFAGVWLGGQNHNQEVTLPHAMQPFDLQVCGYNTNLPNTRYHLPVCLTCERKAENCQIQHWLQRLKFGRIRIDPLPPCLSKAFPEAGQILQSITVAPNFSPSVVRSVLLFAPTKLLPLFPRQSDSVHGF